MCFEYLLQAISIVLIENRASEMLSTAERPSTLVDLGHSLSNSLQQIGLETFNILNHLLNFVANDLVHRQ